MNLYKINIHPIGKFHSLIKGDMLFGIFCWYVRDRFGETKLNEVLQGYTDNSPFAVFSDAFPKGYIPKPVLPFSYYRTENDQIEPDASKRKEFKKREWLPADKLNLLSTEMAQYFEKKDYYKLLLCTSNHVNPQIGKVTGGKYSAFTQEIICYQEDLSVYMLLDESKLSKDEAFQILQEIGLNGYGKKSSSGYGKFEIINLEAVEQSKGKSKTILTLSPLVPVNDKIDAEKTFYKIFVRYGRHGNVLAVSENPFKKPIITMDTGAVLTFKEDFDLARQQFFGTGIKNISMVEKNTVFQGYTIILPLNLKETEYAK